MRRVDEVLIADSYLDPQLFKANVYGELMDAGTFLAEAAWTRKEFDRAAGKGGVFLFHCDGREFVPRLICDARLNRQWVQLVSASLWECLTRRQIAVLLDREGQPWWVVAADCARSRPTARCSAHGPSLRRTLKIAGCVGRAAQSCSSSLRCPQVS